MGGYLTDLPQEFFEVSSAPAPKREISSICPNLNCAGVSASSSNMPSFVLTSVSLRMWASNPMAKEIFPSSYICDCGHQSDFFENTVRGLKRKSMKRRIYLVDGESEEHTIVFFKGEMEEIICPKHDQPFRNEETFEKPRAGRKRSSE